MTKSTASPIHALEIQEVIQKLKEAGYSELVDCLIDNERDCYTKKGRLNKSSACRKLNWKGKKLEDALKQMRSILQLEFDLDLDLDEDEEENEKDC